MEIKVTFEDGDFLYTKINGSEMEIINYYNDNNFLASCSDENKQVIEIGIEINPVGFIGCSARTIVYPFTYNESAKCYLY